MMKQIHFGFLFILFALMDASVLHAQSEYPSVAPTGIFVNHEGEEEEIVMGGTYDAPLTVQFKANPSDTAGYTVVYEWNFYKIEESKEVKMVTRFEENTSFTFTEGGEAISYKASLSITYRNNVTKEEGVVDQDDSEMLKFSLRGSSIHVYNGFSPNGDGVNDVFRVKTQSLLSFRMAIFNRWGQKIVSGDEKSLPVEYEDNYAYYVCWDGKKNGSLMPDGVYYIVVEAVGADGTSYTKRSDINVLTQSKKNSTSTTNE